MSGLKTYGTIAIMIGCFAIVYPRFMHPIVANILGFGDAARKDSNSMYPPGHTGHSADRGHGGGTHPDEVRRHMRHGPHPGMRAAAEMQRQQSAQGSGRGMMGVVLPMYAVGIVLYLGYTLYKVFNKSNAKNNNGRYSWDKTSRYGRDRDRMGFPKDFNGPNSEIRNFLHDQEHRQNLEDLLTRVDDKNVSVEEMKVLQKRLEETEAQMTRILQAMRGINENVDNLAGGETGGGSNQDYQANVDANTENVSGNIPPQEDKSTVEASQPVQGDKEEEVKNVKGDQDESTSNADKEDADGDEEKKDESDECEDEGVVDEVIDEKKDEDADDDDTTAVRQRNVKSNEQ